MTRRCVPVLLAAVLVGCGGTSAADDHLADQRIRIVTTVAPLTSIVSAVVGDRAIVTGLVPEGTNSHTYEPPPSTAATLADADVVFLNGLQLEEPTSELAQANLADGAEIVELGTAALPVEDYVYDFSFPESGGRPNPHLWTHPRYALEYAEIVADVVSARDPANAAAYGANLAAFAAQVDELDAAMREAFATVPQRLLLTYHDAYAYFARDYGWDVIGAVQVSDFEEPTPREVAGIIDQVRSSGVPAIFGSEVFPSPVLAQIGAEADVEYVDVLRDDDLPGEPGDAEHSWLGLMVFDYTTMTTALGGDASALEALDLEPAVVDAATYPQ